MSAIQIIPQKNGLWQAVLEDQGRPLLRVHGLPPATAMATAERILRQALELLLSGNGTAPAPAAAPEPIAPAPAEPAAVEVFTSVPMSWIGTTLYDWGTKGLRGHGNDYRAGKDGERARKAWDRAWNVDLERIRAGVNPALVRAIKGRTNQVWPVKERKGKFWKTAYYLVPRALVAELGPQYPAPPRQSLMDRLGGATPAPEVSPMGDTEPAEPEPMSEPAADLADERGTDEAESESALQRAAAAFRAGDDTALHEWMMANDADYARHNRYLELAELRQRVERIDELTRELEDRRIAKALEVSPPEALCQPEPAPF